MIAHLSSSLGLFAVVWSAFCALSSAVVVEAMLRRDEVSPDPRENDALGDGTGLNAGR